MVRPLIFLIMGPQSHFSGCEVISLVRSSTVWNTTMMEKAFCKSMDDAFSRSISKSITRIRIYSIKDKALSFPWSKCANIVNLSPGH